MQRNIGSKRVGIIEDSFGLEIGQCLPLIPQGFDKGGSNLIELLLHSDAPQSIEVLELSLSVFAGLVMVLSYGIPVLHVGK